MHQASPTQRQLRVAEQVKRALSTIFMRGMLTNPILSGVTLTVSQVHMSPDLQHARVYIQALNTPASGEVIQTLNQARGFFRKHIACCIYLKYTPALTFEADPQQGYADRMNQIFKAIADEKRGND